MSERLLRGARWVALSFGLALAGCSTEPLSGRSANVVFLTETDCDFFVVQSLREGYAVLARQSDDLVPRRGDVLEGGVLRRGRVTFRYLPFGQDDERDEAPSVIVNVDRAGLNVVQAQARLATACSGDA